MPELITRESALDFNYRATGLTKEALEAVCDAVNAYTKHIMVQPTVDANTVIRCWECSHGEKIVCADGKTRVTCWNRYACYEACTHDMNWFCAEGERG